VTSTPPTEATEQTLCQNFGSVWSGKNRTFFQSGMGVDKNRQPADNFVREALQDKHTTREPYPERFGFLAIPVTVRCQ
jgi:hypothetical protein